MEICFDQWSQNGRKLVVVEIDMCMRMIDAVGQESLLLIDDAPAEKKGTFEGHRSPVELIKDRLSSVREKLNSTVQTQALEASGMYYQQSYSCSSIGEDRQFFKPSLKFPTAGILAVQTIGAISLVKVTSSNATLNELCT